MTIGDRLALQSVRAFDGFTVTPDNSYAQSITFHVRSGIPLFFKYSCKYKEGENLIPVFARRPLYNDVELGEPRVTVVFHHKERSTTEFRSAPSLLLRMLEGSFLSGELYKYVFNEETYYVTKGLLLDRDFKPLIVLSRGVDINTETHRVQDTTKKCVEINNAVFINDYDSKLLTYIVKKLIPNFVTQGVTLIVRDNIELFDVPALPKKLSTLQEDITTFVRNNAKNVIAAQYH